MPVPQYWFFVWLEYFGFETQGSVNEVRSTKAKFNLAFSRKPQIAGTRTDAFDWYGLEQPVSESYMPAI